MKQRPVYLIEGVYGQYARQDAGKQPDAAATQSEKAQDADKQEPASQ